MTDLTIKPARLTTYRLNEHQTNSGRPCFYSLQQAPAPSHSQQLTGACPTRCTASAIEEVPGKLGLADARELAAQFASALPDTWETYQAAARQHAVACTALAAHMVSKVWSNAAQIVFAIDFFDGARDVSLLLVRDADDTMLWFNPNHIDMLAAHPDVVAYQAAGVAAVPMDYATAEQIASPIQWAHAAWGAVFERANDVDSDPFGLDHGDIYTIDIPEALKAKDAIDNS